MGADKNQQVHERGAGEQQIADTLQSNFLPYRRFSLGQNVRNTYETYKFSRQFIQRTDLVAWDDIILERLLHTNRRGLKPSVITFQDIDARDAHLRTILNSADGSVGILCPLGPLPTHIGCPDMSVDEMYTLVTGMGFPATMFRAGTEVPTILERYVVTTFISAKGMEFDTVIIPRINFHYYIPKQWYVASTRSKGRLFIYCDLNDSQHDPISQFDTDTYDRISLETVPEVTIKSDNDLPF